jgi:hypothetical protein
VKQTIRIALCAGLLAVGTAGCNDFLKGGELSHNPTRPVTANISQLFVSSEVALWGQQTESLGRLVAMWTQQLEGVARQAKGTYTYVGVSEGTFDGEFEIPYIGGGLIDLHVVDSMARASNDRRYLGMAQIIEAMLIGTTADMWGDIPYSQAAQPDSFPTPQLDPQMTVYDSLQTLLSAAIDNLASGEGVGPEDADLVYGASLDSQSGKWIALAHSLKARLHLHTAEARGASAYAAALAEAQLGIRSNGGDYVIPFTGAAQGESNPWWQFMDNNGGTGRAGDLVATDSIYLYTLLDSLGDPRLAEYYDLTNKTGGYLSKFRDRAAFPQPIVTYNERLLIEAEALYAAGNESAALDTLNAERAAWATATPWHRAITLPAISASGPALLAAIMREKYITLFQNVEVWNDYKRTCIPALHPVNGASVIPGRLLYGLTERQTNPNVPDVGAQPPRNANDPNACPTP